MPFWNILHCARGCSSLSIYVAAPLDFASLCFETGTSSCYECSRGTYSLPGSVQCEAEDSIFRIIILISLPESQFIQLQNIFDACIAQVGGLPLSEVQIVNVSVIQSRRFITLRSLPSSILQVTAEVKTISNLFQSSFHRISNKSAIDAEFLLNGLPMSNSLAVQLSCQAGQFYYMSEALGDGSSICHNCSIGTFSSSAAFLTSCQECPMGKFAASVGATNCLYELSTSTASQGFSCKLYNCHHCVPSILIVSPSR